ncbi:SWI/SNF complex 60 kDa subunit [Ceratobasidium sp. AG-I]|nr:SWI/SNF complex 60 kDa subunit [Ceratobasidium sp. AG-I]
MSTAYSVPQPAAPNVFLPPPDLVKKRRKLASRVLPDAVVREYRENGRPDADLYEQLVERERKLDWITQRKRIELQDGLQKVIKTRRTLRVFISHTASNQAWQTTETSAPPNFETGEGVPSWTLRIQGRLLEADVTDASPDTQAAASAPTSKFSSLLKAMRVDIERDPTLYPEPNQVDWHSASQEQPVNGFNITRRGDQPSTRVRILLHLAPQDPSLVRFKLSPPLSALLDLPSATRPDAIAAVWSYVRTNGLFDKADRRKVRADDGLRMLFNSDMFEFHHIPEMVTRHLVQPEPVILTYELKLDAANPNPPPKAFDISIEVDNIALKTKMQDAYLAITQGDTTEIQALEDKVNQTINQITNLSLKREFCKAFAADPQRFINRWIESQSRDLDIILGQGGMAGSGNAKPQVGLGDEDLRRSEFFRLPWVREAIGIHEGLRGLRIPDGATR